MLTATLKRHALLFLILLTAFALRIIWINWLPAAIISDFAWYYERAQSLLTGNGYSINGIPTAQYPPGYPIFLAILLKATGSAVGVKIVQAMMGTFTCYLIYRLARSFTSKATALIACMIAALYPNFIFYANLLASENVFIPLVLGGLIILIDDKLDLSKSLRCVLAGIIFGVASLTRPAIILFPILFFIYLLIQHYGFKKATGYTALMGVAIVAIILPWTIRNYSIFHAPVFISTNGGEVFWMGNSSLSDGGRFYPPDNPLENISDEVARNNMGYRMVINDFKDNPVGVLEVVTLKYPRFFKNPDGFAWNLLGSDNKDWTKEFLVDPFYVRHIHGLYRKYNDYRSMQATLEFILWVGTAMGGLLLWKNKKNFLMVSLIAYWFIFHMVFAFGHPRFIMPIVPINIILSAAFLTQLPRWLLSRPRAILKKPLLHLAGAMLAFTLSFWLLLWWPNISSTAEFNYFSLEILVGTSFAILLTISLLLMAFHGKRFVPISVVRYLEPLWQPLPN